MSDKGTFDEWWNLKPQRYKTMSVKDAGRGAWEACLAARMEVPEGVLREAKQCVSFEPCDELSMARFILSLAARQEGKL